MGYSDGCGEGSKPSRRASKEGQAGSPPRGKMVGGPEKRDPDGWVQARGWGGAVWWRETRHRPGQGQAPESPTTPYARRPAGQESASTWATTRRSLRRRYMLSTRLSESSTPETKTIQGIRFFGLHCSAAQRTSQLGPSKDFARTIIQVTERIAARGCRITLR